MFKVEYSHEDNINWYEDIKLHNEILLYNLTEPTSFYPLLGDVQDDYHSSNIMSIFYRLSKTNNKKIHVISPCINLKQIFFDIRKLLNFSIDIECYCFPWYFLNQYFIRDVYELDLFDTEITNKAIFLSGAKKLCRLFVIKELAKYDGFLYSNMGWVDDKDGVYITKYSIEDFKFKNYLCEVYIKNLSTGEIDIKNVTGDYSVGNMIYKTEYFDSGNKIYYPPNKNLYKNIEKINFHDPLYLYELVPEEYLQSAISFFCETQTVLTSHLTEKTVKNFYYKKPFLGFACKGYYKFLTNNGFELYTELFDYSFDFMDYNDRLNFFINECKKILSFDLDKINKIVKQLDKKIEHNYKNCKRIAKKYKKNFTMEGDDMIIDLFDKLKNA